VHREEVVGGVAAGVVGIDQLASRNLDRFESFFQIEAARGLYLRINFCLSDPLADCCLFN